MGWGSGGGGGGSSKPWQTQILKAQATSIEIGPIPQSSRNLRIVGSLLGLYLSGTSNHSDTLLVFNNDVTGANYFDFLFGAQGNPTPPTFAGPDTGSEGFTFLGYMDTAHLGPPLPSPFEIIIPNYSSKGGLGQPFMVSSGYSDGNNVAGAGCAAQLNYGAYNGGPITHVSIQSIRAPGIVFAPGCAVDTYLS